MATSTQLNSRNQSVKHAEKPKKQKTAGTELTRQTTLENGDTNSPYPQTRSTTSRSPSLESSQKLRKPRLLFRETVDARAYTIEDPPNRYEEDYMTECNEEPTQDWQRRWNISMILRHNARHPDDPTPILL